MIFKHGIETKELESGEKSFLSLKAPIVVIGAGTINQGTLEPTNEPVLINNITDATKYFGTANLIEGFNINEVLYTALQLYGVAPVICINVINKEKHAEAVQFDSVVVKNRKFVIEKTGLLKETLRVLKGSTSEEIPANKYIVTFNNNGFAEIELEDGAITTVEGTYKRLNPALVTKDDIIGEVNLVTLKKKGLEAIDNIFTNFSMIPGIVVSPKYIEDIEVRNLLITKLKKINNQFTATVIGDIPETVSYGEAIKWKKDNNAIDPILTLCFGRKKIGDKIIHHSTELACQEALLDAENSGVPCLSPSNKLCKTSTLVLKVNGVYEEFKMDSSVANLLNENGIVTSITSPNGFVFWGNRTAAFFPGGTGERKDIWIHAKRLIQFLTNTIAINNFSEVDKNMTKSRAIAIRDNINRFLNGLKSKEQILGGRVEFREQDNTPDEMAGGKFEWLIAVGDVPIGENLVFGTKITNEYITELYSN